MGSLFAPIHLIVILILLFILFGRGRMSDFMEDLARGIKKFQKGLQEGDNQETNRKEAEQNFKTLPVENKNDPFAKNDPLAKAENTPLSQKKPTGTAEETDAAIQNDARVQNIEPKKRSRAKKAPANGEISSAKNIGNTREKTEAKKKSTSKRANNTADNTVEKSASIQSSKSAPRTTKTAKKTTSSAQKKTSKTANKIDV